MAKKDPPSYTDQSKQTSSTSLKTPKQTHQMNTVQGHHYVAINPALEVMNICPAGGYHTYRTEYTTCGILWLILCFPWGIFCFLDSRRYVCLACGADRQKSVVLD